MSYREGEVYCLRDCRVGFLDWLIGTEILLFWVEACGSRGYCDLHWVWVRSENAVGQHV